jgi:pimeloyl-ACP methyl ester carboxylesterase
MNVMRNRFLVGLAVLVAFVGVLWVAGPREPASLRIDHQKIKIGDDIEAYLVAGESRFDDIIAGVEKRVIWAGQPHQKSPVSLVYIHGFSASSEEIRPVPDRVAKALGANLFFTRLTGHGRGSKAMAEANVAAWMQDVGEALEIGRQIGDTVIVMATSTGGTLVAAAMQDPASARAVEGIVFISPNFAIGAPSAALLTWPFARHWVPLIVGEMRHTEPRNPLHARYWTTSYPSRALLPMAALVAAVDQSDFSNVQVPALFYFSKDDQVVNPDATAKFLSRWGGPAKAVTVEMGVDDDQYSHLIAGDIVSPGQNDAAVRTILDWIAGL